MHLQIFVNLPVRDLKRSVDFFTKLGYTFNPQFTDENATCMILGENLHVMLLVEKFFSSFTSKGIADTSKSTRGTHLRLVRFTRPGGRPRRKGPRGRREDPAPGAGPRLHVRAWLRGSRRTHLGAHPHERPTAARLRAARRPLRKP